MIIKFRGQSMGGNYYEGDLTKKALKSGSIVPSIKIGLRESQNLPVIEKTIAQFLGYDKNGLAIFSDDFVRDLRGSHDKVLAADVIYYGEIGNTFNHFELIG